MKSKCLFSLLLMGVNVVLAQTPSMVENSLPGQWEFSLEIQQNGVTTHQNKVSKCVTPEELKVNKSENLQQFIQQTKLSCSTKEFKNTKDSTHIILTCSSKEQTQAPQEKTITLDALYVTHTEDNSLVINSSLFDGTHKSTIISKIEGKKLGECH